MDSVCVFSYTKQNTSTDIGTDKPELQRAYTSGCSLGPWQPSEGHWGVLCLYLLGGYVPKGDSHYTEANKNLADAQSPLLGEDSEGENE